MACSKSNTPENGSKVKNSLANNNTFLACDSLTDCVCRVINRGGKSAPNEK